MGNAGPLRGGEKTHVDQLAARLRTGRPVRDGQGLGRDDQHVDQLQGDRDQHLQPLVIDLLPRMGEAVVPDLLKAAGQDMLQEPPEELFGGDRHGPPARAAVGAVGEGHAAQAIRPGLALHDPPVADGHAVDIRGQIAQGAAAIADGLAVDNPGFVPDLARRLVEEPGLRQEVPELGAEDDRGGFHRKVS